MNFRPIRLFFLVLLLLATRLSAQDIRITEFLATNVTDITDEDQTAQPWIELWNPSRISKFSLSGWKLSNETTTWTIPAVEILPDERLIIWASGKNRTVVTAPLHTNFTLPAEGGTLTLLRANATIASRFSAYPAQQPNVSYGRDEVDAATIPTLIGFYSKPTPGDRNNYSGTGVSGKVLIDTPSRAYTGSITVTLSQAKPNAAAVIRYTTTGTMPTASSPQYSAPLTVSTTQIIRARTFQPGLLPGETETQGYLLLDGSTSGFSSAMPLVALSNSGAGQPPADGDQNAFIWVWEPMAPDNRARFTNAPTLAYRIVMDRRGSSTLDNPKYNVNVEFRKSRDDDDDDVELLGMSPGSDFVFGAPYEFDRSDLHNPFMYALSNQVGRYAPNTRMAEVFFDVNGGAVTFNGGASGDYFGVYNLVEKIRRDVNRVDVVKLDPYDNDTVKKTGGFIWKVDRLDGGDAGFSAGGQSMAYYYPKELEIKSPQRDPQEQFLSSYINSFNSALQSANFKNPTTGYAAFLDVPAAIDHHLLNVWSLNVDALRLSGYWHKERGGKLIPGPIWDFDRTLSSTDGRDANPATWRSQTGDLGTDFFNYVWWNRLFLDIDFYQKYIDRWQELRRGTFSPANVNALLDSLNAQISTEAINRDVARWAKTKRNWTSPFTQQNFTGQAAEVQRIKDWLQQRANFFNSQWIGPVTTSLAEGNVPPNSTVTLTGPAGSTIYYTLDGSDPRPSGGAAPGAGVLTYTAGTQITIGATTRIRARAYNAAWLTNNAVLIGANNPPLRSAWGGLTNVRYAIDAPATSANLAISELSYHPTDPTPTELAIDPLYSDSDFEFIELRNTGATTIDLAGMQFTLGITFTFSGNNAISLPPGAFVIVAANPAAFALRYGNVGTVLGPWNGDLSNNSEQLVLKSAAGSSILDFTYDDAWYPLSDGAGNTLVVVYPNAEDEALSLAGTWRASQTASGSPGAADLDFVVPEVTGTFVPLTIPANAAGKAIVPDYLPLATATDNIGVITLTQSPVAGTEVSVGITPVVLTAVDAAGNSGTASFELVVTDVTPPVVGGTFNPLTLTTNLTGKAALPNYVPSAMATDNIGVTSVTQAPEAGAELSVGITQVIVTAKDAAGNSGTIAFDVTVTDGTAPVIEGTFAPLNIATGPGGTAILPDYTINAQVTDNVAVTGFVQLPSAGTALPVGTTMATLKAVDGAGNVTIKEFTVTVTDGTVPVIGGTFAPLTLDIGAGGTTPLPDYTGQAVTSDNVGIATVTQSPTPGTLAGTGPIQITLTASDAAGNSATTSFTVTVGDSIAPTITAPAAGFTPLSILLGENDTVQLPDYTTQAVATDNVAVTGVTQTPAPGSAVGAGVTVVTLTARDAANNSASTTLNVTVLTGEVQKGDDVPGVEGATFSSFGVPSINDAGVVAFSAKWTGPLGAGAGIFGGAPAALLVKVGDAVPGVDGATFKTFADPLINAAGKVAFIATIQGGGASASTDTVLVTNAFGAGALTVVAREGTSSGEPDLSLIGSFRSISLQGSELLYVVTLKGGRPAVRSTSAMTAFRITNDLVTRRVVRAGQVLGSDTIKSFQMLAAVAGSPGQNRSHVEGTATFLALLKNGTQALIDSVGTELAPIVATGQSTGGTVLPTATFKSFGPVAADSTHVAMAATLNVGTGDVTSANARAIFLGSNAGFEPVARLTQEAPGISGATFRTLGDPVLAPLSGAVAFPATLKGTSAAQDSTLWWKPAAGTLTLIAREGDQPPGVPAGAKWKKFVSLALSGGTHGAPLFYAQLAPRAGGVNAGNDFGLWAMNHAGELKLLAREGDVIGGKQLKTITVLNAVAGAPGVTRSFNNTQSVVYRATFTDNSQSILIVPIP